MRSVVLDQCASGLQKFRSKFGLLCQLKPAFTLIVAHLSQHWKPGRQVSPRLWNGEAPDICPNWLWGKEPAGWLGWGLYFGQGV